ncbi:MULTISPECIES: Spy/CpxP family protein refolding chaperone [Acidovorax]|uniref:Spy/CpxP family protein refolding chaperone n=1 Tax=Acidovorax TaxID=12916 RepID=UPI0002377898|nr:MULTISPECIES: Spy/CpxP family protein refolding chaperone [Acidovorax]KRD21953.1 hypothetical protein ASE39_06030 [Acidovorax sp. Root267]KRD46399.1 hypothetical protein ASE52_17190 [Acidovorax sp. Root275]MBD9392750.1 Spy/CpxP family protein refolding chaperone [Acidovorax sp. ACV01]
MVFKFQHHLAATAVLAALALPVLAQQPPAAPPAAGATAPEGRHKAGDRHERHQAHMAQRMAALKGQLKLTAAQEPAWTAFTAAMQPGERTARLDHKDMDKLTTPERIDRMRALRAQHAAEADRRGEATKTFYAALTPEQQKTFDAQAHRGHRMGGMKGEGEGRHGHHGMRGGEGHHPKPPAAPAK